MAKRISPWTEEWLTREAAVDAYLDYEDYFGRGHALLARHAAFPLILSPELVNLIWINFADRNDVSWVAGPDFLLSRLCRPIGDGLYQVDPNAREVMLVDLVDQEFDGPRRLRRLADFLLGFIARRSWATARPEVLRAYQWIAWSYLDPERVVTDMTRVLQTSVDNLGKLPRWIAQSDQRRVAAFLELIRAPLEFSLPLEKYQDLVETADFLVTYWFPGLTSGLITPSENTRFNPLLTKVRAGLLLTAHTLRTRPGSEQSQEVLLEAVATARAINDDRSRVEALVNLAPHLAGEQLQEVLQEAVATARAINDDRSRVEALVNLAPYLAEEQLQEVLATALNIGDTSIRGEALVSLAPYLAEEQLQEVLATALNIGDTSIRAEVLVELSAVSR